MNIFHFFAIDLCGWARPGGGAATGQNRPKYGGFPLPAARAGQDGAGGLPPRAGPDRWKKYAGTAGFWPPRGGRAGAGAQNRSACGAGRRGRASPARRPGPMEKVCRYGRVLAAAGRARGGGGAKSVSARGRTARAGFPPRAGPDRWEKYTGTAGFWPRGGGGQPRGAGAQNQSARGAGRRGRASPRAQARTDGKSMPVRQGFGRRRTGGRQPRGRARKIGQRARGGGRTWSGGSIIAQAGESPRDGA